MDNRMAEIVKTAMTPYKLNLKAGDRVLIVADTGTDPMVVNAFMAAAHALDIVPVAALGLPVPFHHAAPDQMQIDAMDSADLVHLVTSKGVIHADPCHKKQLEGKRFLASEEITVEMLRAGAATADYEYMNRLGEKIYDLLMNGKTMRVTSPEGMDWHAEIDGRPSWLCAAKVLENPGCDLFACGFPDGEAGMSPIEESIEGTIVWDTSMHQIGLLSEPIRAVIKHGRAVEITGGPEAQRLINYLEENGDDHSWIVGETSVGLNERARTTGFVREDKKLAGCMHIALGMNTDTGGKNASKTHIDGVCRHPTLYVDDTLVLKDGKIMVSI
jgi:leucyl aminopeptidase (aminopeptidase T)